jgi:diguanylate cyclase
MFPVGYEAFIAGAAITGLTLTAGMIVGYWFAVRLKNQVPIHPDQMMPVLNSMLRCTHGVANDVSQYRSVIEATQQAVEQSRAAMSPKGDAESAPLLRMFSRLVDANEQLNTKLSDAETQLRQQEEEIASYMTEARTDVLTTLPNRRSFDSEFNRTFAQWKRYDRPFSILMIDLDHFKRINDTCGHSGGDAVLSQAAKTLRITLRETDLLARYGGEEFVAILTTSNQDETLLAAERLRKALAATPVVLADGRQINITTSIGGATTQGLEDETALIERADEALYTAKKAGRNCCRWHDGVKCIEPAAEPKETCASENAGPDPFKEVCSDLRNRLVEVSGAQ